MRNRHWIVCTGALALTLLAGATSDAAAQKVAEGSKGRAVQTVETQRRSREPANPTVYRAARAHQGLKIMVSTRQRRLLLVAGKDTLLRAGVGIGMAQDFEYEGRKFRFETPTGRRRVIKKEENPFWTVPEWHYMERAAHRNLELVRLQHGDTIELEDGSYLTIQDKQVGRVNQFGNFWAFEPGMEIIFDGKVFMPPMDSPQRRVPEALGPFKLDMGDGYLIHGVNIFNEDTIGQLVSHGCVRLSNDDLEKLYGLVKVGTPVFIY